MDLPDDVVRVVRRYLDAADAAAPGLVEGLHLVGSTVLADYHPGSSDVDFVAVTSSPLTAGERDVLAEVHRWVGTDGPAFDGPYVTADELRASPGDAAEGAFHLDGRLQVGRGARSPVEWTTLARHGVAVRGPVPEVHTDAVELAAWTRDNLRGYWSSWLDSSRDPTTPAARALLTDWGVAWVVLGVSRLHYTLASGDITSKTGAGHHALATFPARWHDIVEEALRCRPRPLTPAAGDTTARRREAREFLAFAIAAALRSAT